jgi:hypothetical protein
MARSVSAMTRRFCSTATRCVDAFAIAQCCRVRWVARRRANGWCNAEAVYIKVVAHLLANSNRVVEQITTAEDLKRKEGNSAKHATQHSSLLAR